MKYERMTANNFMEGFWFVVVVLEDLEFFGLNWIRVILINNIIREFYCWGFSFFLSISIENRVVVRIFS